MIHYSCDRCKRAIDSDGEPRFVVKLEVVPEFSDIHPAELDDDRDYLLELHELLEKSIDEVDDRLAQAEPQSPLRYDLCQNCYKKFISNPLGREPAVQFDFSEN